MFIKGIFANSNYNDTLFVPEEIIEVEQRV